jgi:hypothetical protein
VSRLGTEIDRVNARSRADARKVGRAVYQHLVTESWPGCVDCGQPIRHPYQNSIILERRCGCPGRVWRCGGDGWAVAWSVMAEEARGHAEEAPADDR